MAEDEMLSVNRRVLEAASTATWEWDVLSGRITWSVAGTQLPGLSEGSVTETLQSYLSRVEPADQQKVVQAVELVLTGSADCLDVEYRVAGDSGRPRWLHLRGQVYRDHHESPLKITGTLSETTEWRLAQEFTAFVLEACSDALWTGDLDSALTAVLRRTCELLGLDAAQIWFPTPDGTRLRCGEPCYMPSPQMDALRKETVHLRLSPGEAMPGRAWQTRQMVWLDVETEAVNLARRDAVIAAGLNAALVVPVLSGREVVAILEFGTHDAGRPASRTLRLVAALAEELGPVLQRRRMDAVLSTSRRELNERVKELTALHGAAQIMSQSHLEPQVMLEQLAALLPPAFQYPEVTAGRIRLDRFEVATSGFDETLQRLALAFTAGGSPGSIEVVYREERPAADEGPFLIEERQLLSSLSKMIRTAWERRRAREALARREEFLAAVLQQSSDNIAVVSREGVTLFASAATERLTGYTPEELLGRCIFDPIHLEDRETVAAWFHREFEREGPWAPIEYRHRHKDGSWQWLEAVGRPFVDERGHTVGIINTRDVTHRRRAEDLLNRRNHVLELIATGASLASVLGTIAQQLEEQLPGRECTFLLLEPVQGRTRFDAGRRGAPPSAAAAPAWASRAGHASRGDDYRRMATSPITLAADPRWKLHQSTLQQFARRGCWANFVPDATGNVLGALFLCGEGEQPPLPEQQELMVRFSDLAGIAIGKVQAEVALRQSEERLRAVVEASPIGIAYGDLSTHLLGANQAVQELLGYEAEELVGLPAAQFFHPVDLEKTGRLYEELLSGARPSYQTEVRLVTKDGQDRFGRLTGSLVRDADGTPLYSVGMVEDITEARAAEIALRIRDSALAALPYGFVITDPHSADNAIIYANPAFERITGYAAAEVLGRNCRFLQGPNTDGETVRLIREAVRGKRPVRCEILNYRKDGTPFWNALALSPIRGANGETTHFVGIQADVTDRRTLEEQLRQSQKMEAIGKLAGGVAHDFNNMLAVINGYSDLLLQFSGEGMAPAMRGQLMEIRRAGERASGLTRQLLAFSRQQILEPKVLDVGQLVQDMGNMIRRLVREDIELSMEVAPVHCRVKADPGQIEQVLLNLVVNSRDAMPDGGRLAIRVENRSLSPELSGPDAQGVPGEYLMLAVSDTGCGIEPGLLGRIFEPFFTTKEAGRGTGLGLSTVFGIVKQSDGQIQVESQVGRGTTFSIFLPCTSEQPAALAVPRTMELGGRETVLLVEDEEQVRSLVEQILETYGYAVVLASNGDEALRIARERTERFDLLLTDLVMPGGLGGRRLAEELRRRQPDLKVLYMSGYTDDAVVHHETSDAGVAFLQKPFTSLALARKVREVLG